MWPDHVHGHAADQIVTVNRNPNFVGNDHHRQHGAQAGKYEAENRNDQCSALQVAQLRAGDFTVYLRQRFFTAHSQNGVAKRYQDPEQAKCFSQVRILQESQCLWGELEVGRNRPWRQRSAGMQDRVNGPDQQDNHHHRGDLHYAQSFVAGFFNTFEVLPPVVQSHDHRERRRCVIQVQLRRAVKHHVHGVRDPAVRIGCGK